MSPRVVLLSGGVGGARFAHGLARVVPAERLTIVVNTGDDFTHWGLRICPDLDTVMYTLAGVADAAQGWGVAGESFATHEQIQRLGGETWFRLGDRDLATHLLRTESLAGGETLSQVTARLAEALEVGPRLLPMSDAPQPTRVVTDADGVLDFQPWLVRRRAEPLARALLYGGDGSSAPGVCEALLHADLVLLAPSNPYVSIDPILRLNGVRDALSGKVVVGVSPIVGGRAVKGPLATMLGSVEGRAVTAGAVASHYGDLLSGWVVERGDEATVEGGAVMGTETIMGREDDRRRLADETLKFAEGLQ